MNLTAHMFLLLNLIKDRVEIQHAANFFIQEIFGCEATLKKPRLMEVSQSIVYLSY